MSNYFFDQIPAHQKRLTLSTSLTLLRIILSPVLVACMANGWWSLAFLVFITAALSDLLDGFLARLRNEQTLLGACLDPIADKIFIISSFATVAFIQTPLFTIPGWFIWLMLLKEIALILGISVLYFVGLRIDIKPTILSKTTTAVQLLFIGWLFIVYFFNWLPLKTYYVLLGSVVVMTCMTLFQYAYIGFFRRR